MPLIKWTIVRLVVFQKTTGRHNSEMEPQERTTDSPARTRRGSKTFRPEKSTLGPRVHVQTVGLNAETKKDRDRADGEIFLLTLPLIGLRRFVRLPGTATLNSAPPQRGDRIGGQRYFSESGRRTRPSPPSRRPDSSAPAPLSRRDFSRRCETRAKSQRYSGSLSHD